MVKLTGNFTKHIKVEDYMWSMEPNYGVMTPESLKFILALEEWITWVRRKVIIHGMYRSQELNTKFKGHPASNHMRGLACDFHVEGIDVDTQRFIKYAKKWKHICKKYGFVGEAGLYGRFMHFGVQKYSKHFYNWDSRSGRQVNMAFKI